MADTKQTPGQDREFIEKVRDYLPDAPSPHSAIWTPNEMEQMLTIIDRLEAEKAELVAILKRLDAWARRFPDYEPMADILRDARAILAKTEPPTTTNPKPEV